MSFNVLLHTKNSEQTMKCSRNTDKFDVCTADEIN